MPHLPETPLNDTGSAYETQFNVPAKPVVCYMHCALL